MTSYDETAPRLCGCGRQATLEALVPWVYRELSGEEWAPVCAWCLDLDWEHRPLGYRIGDRVEGGDTPEDYDTGEVVEVDGDQITVAWSGSLVQTTQPASVLRREGARMPDEGEPGYLDD